jgi:RHS repeat-associated protein
MRIATFDWLGALLRCFVGAALCMVSGIALAQPAWIVPIIELLLANRPAVVSLTSPANGATFAAPATVNLTAAASSPDGTIAKVEFFQGTTLIATVTSPPYTHAWSGVGASAYSLSAKATDNEGNVAVSSPVGITVATQQAGIFYIHVDHLNTPRAVYDSNQQLRWRWDQAEPFGVNTPDENPSSLGVFEMPLRYPGQYQDKETGLVYNEFRDFDAAAGRYLQSDPIGLVAGLNTYSYVDGSPLSYSDPEGLQKPEPGFGFARKLYEEGTGRRSAGAQNYWGNAKTLPDHYKRHGPDFGAKTPDEYALRAREFFRQSQMNRFPTKIDKDGTIRCYDPKSNTFGSYNPDGTTKTFYKPDPAKHGRPTNMDYWKDQPGSAPWSPAFP